MARVVVITGPSGVGKGTLIRQLRDRIPELELSVSATTRSPRAGEVDGQDYWFLTHDDFDHRVSDGGFVEWAEYSGNKYGTLRSELDRRVADGRPVLLEIEVQGARQVAETMPEALRIFIAPPSPETLRTRLVGRGTDEADQIARRLAVAEDELAAQPEFPVVVINDRLEDAIEALTDVVRGGIDEARSAEAPAG